MERFINNVFHADARKLIAELSTGSLDAVNRHSRSQTNAVARKTSWNAFKDRIQVAIRDGWGPSQWGLQPGRRSKLAEFQKQIMRIDGKQNDCDVHRASIRKILFGGCRKPTLVQLREFLAEDADDILLARIDEQDSLDESQDWLSPGKPTQ